MAEPRPVAPPHGRYRRGLEGASFSLEANTENVPADGRFYLLADGKIILGTDDFEEATREYHALCREHWKKRLDHQDTAVRIAAAWGLLGLDVNDKLAQSVIQQDGTAQERKRLEQAQSRKRALRARAAEEPPAAVTATPTEAPAREEDEDE